MTADNLGQQAYSVVEELSVHIGPRPAGSEGELRALDYVSDELEKTCHRVRRIPVKGLPGQFPRELLRLVGMLFLVYSVYHLVESPSAMLIYLVAFFGVPKLISEGRKRASTAAERKSENVIGYLSAQKEARSNLVLCAHLDSAKANRVPGELWPKIHRFLMGAWMPSVFAMAGAAVLRWLDMRFGLSLRFFWQPMRDIGLAYAVFFLIFGSFYMYISRGDVYSPGANDNASGVGVVLALARHLHAAPPAHLDMHYVLFTAEELGLVGSERFVKATELPKGSTYVVNLDMVGAGKQLCYVRGSGLIPPRLTDRELNALFTKAYPAIKSHYYFMGDSDFSSFLAKGYRAASLCTKGSSQAETVYHTERDTLEHVDVESLQLTADTVRKVIRLLDERIGGKVTSGQ